MLLDEGRLIHQEHSVLYLLTSTRPNLGQPGTLPVGASASPYLGGAIRPRLSPLLPPTALLFPAALHLPPAPSPP